MDEYPFFFYQPWPLIMSVAGFVLAFIGLAAAGVAWFYVWKMTKLNAGMRVVLMMQQAAHEQEVRHLIERMGGEPVNGAGHTIQ